MKLVTEDEKILLKRKRKFFTVGEQDGSKEGWKEGMLKVGPIVGPKLGALEG